MGDIMHFTDEDAETAINLTIGAASVCWDENKVFESERAVQIGKELLDHLRKLRLVPDEFTRRCGVCYRDVETVRGKLGHQVFSDGSVRCFSEPDRAHGLYISGFVIPVATQHDRRKQAEREAKEQADGV